jgi:superfamily I DNA and/or RNA helicase
MATKEEFNSGLSELLSMQEKPTRFDFSYYKSRLNVEQYQSLINAHQFSSSVIVGPPGTGKSYTITTIVADAVVKKQSVLIVSKTKQAVEVIRSMLRDEFKLKDYLIHTSGTHYKASLKAKIRKYLSGIIAKKSTPLNERRIGLLYSQLTQLEREFEKFIDRELELSDLEFSENLSFFEKWRRFYLRDIKPNGEQLWDLFDQSEALLKKLETEVTAYSRRKIQSNISASTRSFRRDMSLFLDALDSNSFTKYKQLIKGVNHANILKVFPIWLANLADLNAVLPMQKELFDLVIIDEATQCDIASALPAIYRAKRAVIVGDPNQLRHYSFVSNSQQESLLKKFSLPADKMFDYRNRSILDFYISKIQQQDQVTFLREHFRSAPSLIEFSNEQFYDGQIEVMKSTPGYVMQKQIELIEVAGRRDEKGVNREEAIQVMAKLDELIQTYRNETITPSIGIISPFNAQVTHINKLLKDKYELDLLKKFTLLCGTPYHFQGSEREIMLISFCVSDDSHPAAFNHVNKPEVLNVAITRAKTFQYIFSSVTKKVLDQDSLLSGYFRFIRGFKYTASENLLPDEFQSEVVSALQKMDIDDVKTGYPVAGSLLDILITKNRKNYFIDLIGYPGIFKEAFTMERYKTLSRTGIRSMPLHYSLWKKNRAKAINRIKAFINQHH